MIHIKSYEDSNDDWDSKLNYFKKLVNTGETECNEELFIETLEWIMNSLEENELKGKV